MYKSYLVYSVSTFLFDITLFSMITDSTILISAHSKVSIENSFEKRKKTVELPKSQNMSDLQISDSFEKLMSFWIEVILKTISL